MNWLLIAFAAPAVFALANILDNYFSNKIFKSIPALVFYASLSNLLFLPLFLVIEPPEWPTLSILPALLFLGLANLLYLFPYYKALRRDDTSIVISLFSLGKIFVPVLAFFIVRERLSLGQYSGIAIIILASTLLTFNGANGAGKLRFNQSLGYMALSAFIVALETVFFKYVFENVSWSTGYFWALIFSILFAFFFFLIPAWKNQLVAEFSAFRRNFHWFVLEEFFTFAGQGLMTFAISLVAVSLVEGIVAFQPLFVIVYALILSKLLPQLFREKISPAALFRKSMLFLVMVLGVLLILH